MTHRQQRFVGLIASGLSATRAALEAGYSPRSAGQIGHALLKKDEIREAIAEWMEAFELDARETLARLGAQARGHIPTRVREVLGKAGNVVELCEFDMLAALSLLARLHHIGEINQAVDGPLLIVRHPDEALAELVRKDG